MVVRHQHHAEIPGYERAGNRRGNNDAGRHDRDDGDTRCEKPSGQDKIVME